jgi:hypothetical protein
MERSNRPVDLTGAIDLHVHAGPDPYRERCVTREEAVREAAAAGHAGIVLKGRERPSTDAAALLDGRHGIRVVGTLCLDIWVGGINPWAVDAALRSGARMIWLPTFSSVADWEPWGRELGIPFPGVQVCRDGKLVPEAEEVLRQVAEAGAVLATGHVSLEEHFAVARALPSGARLVVTHALAGQVGCWTGDPPDVASLRELAGLGATIEFSAYSCILGRRSHRTPEAVAAAIRALGAERCVISTDLGPAGLPHPVEGLERFAAELLRCGLSEAEIRRMAVANPAELLDGDRSR